MSQIIQDFFRLGTLRVISRILFGLRGLVIVAILTPYHFGVYTIWLLFIFYFSMLDLGVLNGLERDIPHHKGDGNQVSEHQTANDGWSTFFVLALSASVFLGVVSFYVYRQWILSALLAVYLLADKIYRGYETNARIHFKFRESGIAELMSAANSLLLVWILVPRFGIYCIFVGLILSVPASIFYLHKKSPIKFQWGFRPDASLRYIKKSLSLAVMIYSIELFHAVSLTVLAIVWDKTTLGYYAVAFRIFQICLAIFPFLIQEVMRTRMYYHVAQRKDETDGLKELLVPLGMYGFITAGFWLCVFWWADWGIHRFIPAYTDSVWAIKVLTLALVPLGIVKICSDYLCSPQVKQTAYVILSWAGCILLQVFLLVFIKMEPDTILKVAPVIYLLCTGVAYVLVVGRSFRVGQQWKEGLLRMGYLLLPLTLGYILAHGFNVFFQIFPSKNFWDNAVPFVVSMGFLLGLMALFFWLRKFNKTIGLFLPGVR